MKKVFNPCDSVLIRMKYRNWKGVVADRCVTEPNLWFGSTEYHKEEQWLMRAFDVDKGEYRDFALKDILQFY
ncbi:hypothetical protein CPT_Murica90 [Escherichia phage Murica]|nr:hypothetical protein FDG88_gp189 [Escherichia phage Murica]AKU44182.1 hypothetical protein CPT_Murica90 [Escherichia phage Murica]